MNEQESNENAELLAEVQYYRKLLDGIAGENLKLDYTISGLRHELKQKREGFSLLAQLHGTLGQKQELEEIFKTAISAINSTLGMDKSVVLIRNGDSFIFSPRVMLGAGFNEKLLMQQTFEISEEIIRKKEAMIVIAGTQLSPLQEKIKKTFDLPYYIISPVSAGEDIVGIFVSGRLREAKPLYPPLDSGDADTLKAIGSLIVATMEVMKVATLTEADRLKTEFFANISHEFRTPITLTIGPLEALLSGVYGEVSERIRKEIEIVLRNQRRLLDLINQILDLSKLEAGMMKLQFFEINDFNEFISVRIEQFRALAEKRGLSVVEQYDPEIFGKKIYFDVEKIDKVVFNLLSNALKFTKDGSITIQTKYSDSNIELVLIDTGIGIKSDQVDHIFDRFRQAEGSSSKEFAGTGIGLSLVKEVIELHGGKIIVSSQYGQGTVFRIQIPSGKAHIRADAIIEVYESQSSSDWSKSANQIENFKEGRATKQEEEQIEKSNRESLANLKADCPRILYVDDNPDLRRFVYGLLEKDYNVFLALNGLDGFEKAKLYEVELVLSDLMMPVMTGSQLLEKLRSESETSDIPFIMLTAKSDIETRIEEIEKGTDDFLAKPFSEAELRARIKNLLKIREQSLRIKKDLLAAKKIQRGLLPAFEHQIKDFQLQFFYRPCEDLSGDFFDVIQIKNEVYFYLVDITSHGTAAAQVTYLVKGIFKNIFSDLSGGERIEDIVLEFSRAYVNYMLEYSVALNFCRINLDSQVLEYINSNSPAPFLLADSKISILDPKVNPVIDKLTDFDRLYFEKSILELKGPSRIYFFTDGAYEFQNRNSHSPFSVRDMSRLKSLRKEVNWREEFFKEISELNASEFFKDDITILRITRN